MDGKVNKNRKRIILFVTIAVLVIGAAVGIGTFRSSAMSQSQAEDAARMYVPASAELVASEDDWSKYEFTFRDSEKGIEYDVEVSKKKKTVTSVSMDNPSDVGGTKVVVSEEEAKRIIANSFEGATASAVTLNQDDDGYIYDVDFTGNGYYGDAEINAETGSIMSSDLHFGKAVTVPVSDGDKTAKQNTTKETEKKTTEKTDSTAKTTDSGNSGSSGTAAGSGSTGSSATNSGGSTATKSGSSSATNNSGSTGGSTATNSGSSAPAASTPAPKANTTTNKSTNTSSSSGIISESKARNIVLGQVPGATIRAIYLDWDDGIQVYEGEAVSGNKEYDFEINASTGVITEWSVDTIDYDDDYDDDWDDDDD